MSFTKNICSSNQPLYRYRLTSFIILAAILTPGFALQIKHKFITLSETAGMFYIDQNKSGVDTLVWHVNPPRDTRDLQLIGNNRVMATSNDGVCEYDISTGALKRELKIGQGTVITARRIANGNTYFGYAESGSLPNHVIEIDSTKKVIKRFQWNGTFGLHLMRLTSTGTFLAGSNFTLFEGDTTGKILWRVALPAYDSGGDNHVYKAVRLPNKNIVLATGYSGSIVTMDSAGKVLNKFGGRPDNSVYNNFFYADFQILKNGNIVVANWLGEPWAQYSKGIALIEYDTSGHVVWTWNNFTLTAYLHGIIVLDSMNTSVLNDELQGVMEPVNGSTAIELPHASRYASNSNQNQTVYSKEKIVFLSMHKSRDVSIIPAIDMKGRTIKKSIRAAIGVIVRQSAVQPASKDHNQ